MKMVETRSDFSIVFWKTYFGICQEMLHFYLNSAISLSYYKEIFQNFDVQFHLTMIMLKSGSYLPGIDSWVRWVEPGSPKKLNY